MELEVLNNSNGVYTGTFAVAAVTGPYAFQSGSFEGSITGNSVNIDCVANDGTEFQMTGTTNGSNSLSLTRSDIAGTTLTFLPVTPASTSTSRADLSFFIATGQTNGRATLSSTPYSVQGPLTEYRGTWQTVPVTFWAYSTGQANLIISVDPLSVDSSVYNSYRPSDFPTATVTSQAGTISMYSTASRVTIRMKHTLTLSP